MKAMGIEQLYEASLVMLPPFFDDDLWFPQGVEDFAFEQLVPEPAIRWYCDTAALVEVGKAFAVVVIKARTLPEVDVELMLLQQPRALGPWWRFSGLDASKGMSYPLTRATAPFPLGFCWYRPKPGHLRVL